MADSVLENSYHRMTNSKKMLIFLVYLFVTVTFFTTFNGVISYIFGSVDETSMPNLIIFGAVLFCLQAYLLLRSTYHVIEFKNNTLLKSFLWLIIWVFTFVFSATFSYTFYYDKLSADAHGKRVINQQIDVVVNNAEKYLLSFDSIKSQMDELSTYSRKKATEEKTKGKTCGDNSPPGPGPRIRYRLKEEKVFQEQAIKVSKLHAQILKEIEIFRLQKQKYANKKINTIPRLQQAFNLSVARLNAHNDQHPTLISVSNKLIEHSGGNRKTDGINADGSQIFCSDYHIDQSIMEIRKQLRILKPIPKVILFDRSNRRELQNRVVEVFLSPFKNTSKEKNNDFNKYDYIALALGFLVETLMFIITLILHSGDNNYPANRFGYIGEWFSSQDAEQLKSRLHINKNELMQVMYSARKLQSGYIIIKDINLDFCPIINALDRKGMFSKKLNAIEYQSLPSKMKKFEQYDDKKLVNLYFSPNRVWEDYRLSLTHLKDLKENKGATL